MKDMKSVLLTELCGLLQHAGIMQGHISFLSDLAIFCLFVLFFNMKNMEQREG